MFEPGAILALPVIAGAFAYGCYEPVRTGRSVNRGRCAGCGYALEGLPDRARCPECGVPFDKHERTLVVVRRFSRARLKRVTILLAIACLLPLCHPLSELVWFLSHGYGDQSVRLAFVWAPRNGGGRPAGLVTPTALFLCGVVAVGVVRFSWLVAGYIGAAVALIVLDFASAGHAESAIGLPAMVIIGIVLLGFAAENVRPAPTQGL